jgi:predicted metal-dependent HD superfamily phosphohydrolase
MYDLDKLASKWQQCWQDLAIDSPQIVGVGGACALAKASDLATGRGCANPEAAPTQKENRVFQLLVHAYTQPERHYHNLTHIHHVLTTLDRFSSLLQNPTAVFLAGWFHDFIYDPRAADNELQSAKSAGELMVDIGAGQDLIDRMRELILATQGHQIAADDPDRCIFLDADLAILGADPVRYRVYRHSIRREYSWMSEPAYRTGRIRVLESFLHRDRLFYTTLLFDELESIARVNLNSEILELKSAESIG